jgi:polar amino acid transport system substrate-binding protein
MFLLRRTLLLLAMLLPLAWAPLASAQALRLTSSTQEPYFLPNGRGFLDQIIPELFRRVGVEAVAVQYDAAARANINANNGVEDGVAMRSRLVEKEYPNLIRVDEKIVDMDFVLFSLDRDFVVRGFESLRPYTVGHIVGWKVIEDNIAAGTEVTKAKDPEQLFHLLESRHVDLIVFNHWQGAHILVQRGLKAKMLVPPLVSAELFIYLHKKHARLVEPVAAALRAMKADGSYQRIVAQTLPESRSPAGSR